MNELKFAIEDAKRFVSRVEPLAAMDESLLTDADLKMIRRQSMDVTHAMKALREAVDAVPTVTETAVKS